VVRVKFRLKIFNFISLKLIMFLTDLLS
jgi:hypothetical protein